MTGFPFDAGRIASLSRLANTINGDHAPPPIDGVVVIDDGGRAAVPVSELAPTIVVDTRLTGASIETHWVKTTLHAGLTLQWAPMAEQGGLLLSLWGGSPDGDPDKDGVACFLTRRGLAMMIKDLQAIAARLKAAE